MKTILMLLLCASIGIAQTTVTTSGTIPANTFPTMKQLSDSLRASEARIQAWVLKQIPLSSGNVTLQMLTDSLAKKLDRSEMFLVTAKEGQVLYILNGSIAGGIPIDSVQKSSTIKQATINVLQAR